MANKIYSQTDYSTIDSMSISKDFKDMAVEIANILGKLSDMKGRSEYLHNLAKDNMDVAISLSEAIEKLGIALACAVTYSSEYEKEANGSEDSEKE